MMLLYLFVLLLLVLARVLVAGRARLFEKKFARLARAAREVANQHLYKQGNGSRSADTYAHAKQQYLLGELTAKRDLVEARYEAWQARSEKLAKVLTKIRGYKGKALPYLFGATDVALLLVTLALLGVVEFPALTAALAALWNA